MKRFLVLGALVAALFAVSLGAIPARALFLPLLGLIIYFVGIASLGSLKRGASYIPDGPPEPLDVSIEQVIYGCSGCGAEVLLLVRGSNSAPRHCGERMTEYTEDDYTADVSTDTV